MKHIKLFEEFVSEASSRACKKLVKELKKDCQILGVASSTGLSSESLATSFKIKNKILILLKIGCLMSSREVQM